jgi:hypothetical protein
LIRAAALRTNLLERRNALQTKKLQKEVKFVRGVCEYSTIDCNEAEKIVGICDEVAIAGGLRDSRRECLFRAAEGAWRAPEASMVHRRERQALQSSTPAR